MSIRAPKSTTLRSSSLRHYGLDSRDMCHMSEPFGPSCLLLFSLSSFYAGHNPRVILFVSPLVLLPDADLPKITIKEWSDTVAPYPAVPQ